MKMKIVGISIAAVLVVIVLASVLMPVLDDATTVNESFENDGIRMAKLNDDSSLTIVWDHTAPNSVTIGSNVIDMTQTAGTMQMVCASENFYLRWYSVSDTVKGVQLYNGTTRLDGNLSSGKDLTVTIASGSVTATNGTDTGTFTLGDHAFVRDAAGAYVLSDSASPVKVLGNTEINVLAMSQVMSNSYPPIGVFASGSVDDGMEYTSFYSTYTATFADSAVSSTSVSGFEDLYDVDKCTVSLTQEGITKAATYNTIIVPLEISAERAVHLSDGANMLLSTIPVMIILAIIMGIVAAVIIRQR